MQNNISIIPWEVSLEINSDETCTVAIHGYPSEMAGEFAFYLMRGKERIATRWYSREPMAKFSIPKISGKYHALGFLRRDSSSDVKFRASNFSLFSVEASYDLNQWKLPVFECLDSEHFSSGSCLRDGIYHFSIGTTFLDIRLDGAESLRPGCTVLVCFGGAVPDRTAKIAPFFSGSGVAKQLQTPVLSIADPSLSLSKSLALGWYAGNYLVSSLQLRISRILDFFAEVYDVKFLMFGGSGGGFACLAIQSLMKSTVTAAVWNPQTSISKYTSSSVVRYLDVSFPSKDIPVPKNYYFKLEEAGVLHDLTVKPPRYTHPVLYLQNQSDAHHVQHHAMPFARSRGVRQMSGTVLADAGDLAMWFGCWGKGHAVPPGDMIVFVLRQLMIGTSVIDLALKLEELNPECSEIDFT